LLSRFPVMISAPSTRKPTNQLHLILKRRTQTEDYVVLARAWQAANDKARELGVDREAPAKVDRPGLPTKGVIAGNDHRDHRSKL
jgi:hypothetical protein